MAEKRRSGRRVRAALNFVAAHPQDCETQVIFMYSWNELSEGGELCPTMGRSPEYEPDTRWLDEVREALSATTFTATANQAMEKLFFRAGVTQLP